MTSSWGDLSGKEFIKVIDDAYAQVVHWQPNLFKIPSGACGKHFVAKLTCLFNPKSDLEVITLKAAMSLPSLILQKPHAKSKTYNHISCLKHRLSLWERHLEFTQGGKALQKSLISSRPPKQDTEDHAWIL